MQFELQSGGSTCVHFTELHYSISVCANIRKVPSGSMCQSAMCSFHALCLAFLSDLLSLPALV